MIIAGETDPAAARRAGSSGDRASGDYSEPSG